MEGLEFILNESDKKITERYSCETETISMGCANLSPFFDIKKGDFVLDLGCGNGNQALGLSVMAGVDGKVFGLDMTPAMIKKAQEKINKPNVEFLIGDIHELPFENEYINVVISNCVINHSSDKKKVYAEIFRVLKKNGHFIIGDVTSVDKLPEKIANDPDNIAACWGGAMMKKDYLEIIKNCGFKKIFELSSRRYVKNGFLLESIVLKGEKNEENN
jgi:ubiquinone/menaquinone biosynthesis C-methylase UbiE